MRMNLICAFELNIEGMYIFISLLVLLMLVLLHINFFVFMKGMNKRTARKVKISAKPSKYANGLAVVAGNGSAAGRIIKKLLKEDKRIIHIADKRQPAFNKNVTFVESGLSGDFLKSVGFLEGAHDISVYSVYENDNENLNAALILNGLLQDCLPSSGKRIIKIAYKNIAKTQFYNNLNPCITYFNTDELTARSFTERFNLADYLPKTENNNGYLPQGRALDPRLTAPVPLKSCGVSTFLFKNETVLAKDSAGTAEETPAQDKQLSVRRIFVGFSPLNAEILEKLVFSEKLCEQSLNAVVFDKNADTILPAFYNRAHDVLDAEHIGFKDNLHPSKMIALKIDEEAFELYDMITALCKTEDFCAIYIDIGSSVANTETALELRDTLIKSGASDKAVIFAYNESEDFLNGCGALNSGFDESGQIVFYGASDDLI